MHPRDRAILVEARRILGERRDFTSSLEALRAAVDAIIPAGMIFVIGESAHGPIFGSHVSKIGLAKTRDGIAIVQCGRSIGSFLVEDP